MSKAEYEQDDSPALPDFLRDPLGMIRRRWLWMAVTLGLGLAATTGIIALQAPYYLGTARILVASQRIPEDFVRTTVAEDSLQRIDAMVGQILTRGTISELIARNGLYPDLRDTVTNEGLVKIFREKVTVAPQSGIAPRARDETTRLIRIDFEGETPEAAAGVANEIAGLLIGENIRRRSEQARRTTEFLSHELEQAEQQLREQDREITRFLERYRGELPGELETNLGRLDRLQQQRQSLALQIAEASNRLTVLSSGGNAVDSPTAQLAALRAELESLRPVLTDRHPDILALRDQIASLGRSIVAAPDDAGPADAMLSAERATLARLRSERSRTERELEELDARVARTPSRQEELDAIQQRASVLRENYLEFLRKVQDAKLAESLESAQQGERFSVLERALPPEEPVNSRLMYLIAGLIGALGLAGGVGMLLESLDPVIFSAEQLERLGNSPLFGTVPHIT